jgi:Domain of unknown function (DUF1877)
MIGNFRLASDEEINALLAEPSRIFEFLYGDEYAECAVSVTRRPNGRGFFQRLFGATEIVSLAAADEPSRAALDPADELDVDKAWHGLHFLFTGDAWSGEPPLGFIVAGGTEVGDEDVGYGSARAFTSAEVREISAALDRITGDELARRFDPAQMMNLGIYPEIWDRDPADDDTLAYLLEYFDLLKDFVGRGARSGQGMLVYIN